MSNDSEGAGAFVVVVIIGLVCWGLWPLTGIIVLVPSGIVAGARWWLKHDLEDPAFLVGGFFAAVSGIAVIVQIVLHGRPVAFWLAGGAAALVGLQLAIRAVRGRSTLGHRLLRSARRTLAAVTAGIAVVVATQVVLAYTEQPSPAEILAWQTAIADARTRLGEAVFLGPVELGALLLGLVIVTLVVSPALDTVRAYRGVARAASFALVGVTAAASFSFFTGRQLDHQEGEWLARARPSLDQQLGQLDDLRSDVVELAAIEDALRELPAHARAELEELRAEIERRPAGEPRAVREAREARELEQAIERATKAKLEARQPRKPINLDAATMRAAVERFFEARRPAEPAKPAPAVVDREMMWEWMAPQLAAKLPVAPLDERVQRIAEHVEPDRAAIERLRSGRGARLADLEVLGVQTSRAHAARRELYEAVLTLVQQLVIPRSELAQAFLRDLLARLDRRRLRTGSVDARSVVRALQPPPRVWLADAHVAPSAPATVERTVRGQREQRQQRATQQIETESVARVHEHDRIIEQKAREAKNPRLYEIRPIERHPIERVQPIRRGGR